MTNGEKFKEVFKTSDVDEGLLYAFVWLSKPDEVAEINIEWWNEEYKEPTTKNDLGVDWESYKDVDGNSLDDLILEVLQNNFDCGNTYGYKVADEIIGLLPSVTPQEPRKGHWIEEFNDLEGEVRFTCSSCGKYQLFGTDFCYNCGSDNREVEE